MPRSIWILIGDIKKPIWPWAKWALIHQYIGEWLLPTTQDEGQSTQTK